MASTLSILQPYDPCNQALDWLRSDRRLRNPEMAWEVCDIPSYMIWAAAIFATTKRRKLLVIEAIAEFLLLRYNPNPIQWRFPRASFPRDALRYAQGKLKHATLVKRWRGAVYDYATSYTMFPTLYRYIIAPVNPKTYTGCGDRKLAIINASMIFAAPYNSHTTAEAIREIIPWTEIAKWLPQQRRPKRKARRNR